MFFPDCFLSENIEIHKKKTRRARRRQEKERMPTIVSVVYDPKVKETDVNHIISKSLEEESRVLVIYNANVAFQVNPVKFCGQGSASARIYDRRFMTNGQIARAQGVSTGMSISAGGFPFLTEEVKQIISLELMKVLVQVFEYDYTHIVYFCDKHDSTKIGTSIFKVGQDVIDFISKRILKLQNFDYGSVRLKLITKFKLEESKYNGMSKADFCNAMHHMIDERMLMIYLKYCAGLEFQLFKTKNPISESTSSKHASLLQSKRRREDIESTSSAALPLVQSTLFQKSCVKRE